MSIDDEDTEAKLARVHFRVRAHQRQARIAKATGVGIAFVGMVLGLVVALGIGWPRGFWLGVFGGGVLGAIVWTKLEPQGDIDDIE